MKCPKCVRRLRPDAVSCVCGWKTEESTVSRPALVVDYGAMERERASYQKWLEAGSPTADESMAKIRAFMRKPKPSARQHWERVLRTPNAPLLAQQYAKEALQKWGAIEREPGCDDEQMAA